MPRPVTLFTGQFADLPIATLAEKAKSWGYDGLELACWGDHFEVDKALADPGYIPAKKALLARYGLGVWAVAAHLGRRRSRGCQAARGAGDEGHRAGRGRARRRPGARLHRLEHLAPRGDV